MSMVIGEACQRYLQLIVAETHEAELFVNNHTPTHGDNVDASDYTPASFSGSGPIELDSFSFYTTTDGHSECLHPTLTWTPGSGASGTAFGVVITDQATGDLVVGLRFAVPKAIVEGVPIEADIKALVQRRNYES